MTRTRRIVAVLAVVGCGGTPAPAPVTASNTAVSTGDRAAPAGSLAGTYRAGHSTMVMCDDGRGVECEEEAEDTLVVREGGDGAIAIELETVGTNTHTCTFEGTLERVDGEADRQQYVFSAPHSEEDGDCELTLLATPAEITVTAMGCSYYCGMRATLDSTFTRP